MKILIRKSLISVVVSGMFLVACGGEKPEAMMGAAKKFLAKNDSKSAMIQIKNALQANPDLPEARYLLGKTLLNAGDPVGAEVELQKARDLNFSQDLVIPLQARAFNAQGKYKKVTDELAKFGLSSTEARADLLTSVAISLAASGKSDDAAKILDSALKVLPNYSPALVIQARLRASTGDLSGASAILDSVLAATPLDHEAWKLKGDILASQGEIEKGNEAYRKALEIRPDYILAHAAYVGSLMKQGKIELVTPALDAMKKIAPKHPRTLYLSAQMAYQSKDFKTARVVVQELLSITPNNPNALQLAGAIEIQTGNFSQAESHLTKSVQLAPELMSARRILVTLYLRAGQAAKAMGALQPLLVVAEKDGNLLSLAGEVFLLNGEIEKASTYFSKASQLDPKDVSKRTAVVIAQLAKGDAIGAFRDLEEIASEDSGTTADMALISAHLRRNELDKALKAVESLERKQSGSPAPYQIRGNILRAKQDIPGARKSFERALQVGPTYFAAAASLAALDMADKKPDEAKKRFESILANEPKSVQALLALAELKSMQGGSAEEVSGLIQRAVAVNPSEAGPRVALVSWWLKNKEHKKAMAVAQEAVAAIPDQPELLGVLGQTQQAAGDSNQALATYAKMSSLQPNSPVPHMRAAEIHNQAKNRDSAVQSLRKALAIKSDLVEALRALVALNLDAGNLNEALSVAREVQKKHPKESIGYLLEGDIRASKKAWEEAATAYRLGLRQAPNTEMAIKLHVVLRETKSREADSLEASWLKAHRNDVGFLMYLGDVANSKRDLVGAIKVFRAAVDAQPNNALALNNLAWAVGQQRDPKAIEYAEKALLIMPNQPAIMDTLAVLLSEKGETARAIDLLQKALAISPDASVIRLNYARALIKAGNKLDARKEIEVLEKLGTQFQGQADLAKLKAEL